MAPPSSTNTSMSQRFMALAQTLQFAWFSGHVTLLLCVLRYSLSYITFNFYSRWAQFTYRTAFVAAAATYGIVVYKGYRARTRSGKPQQGLVMDLALDENVQYLGISLIWLFSRQMPLAMLPFAVYSVFHVATYTRSNLIPAMQPPQGKPSAMSENIGHFVKNYYDTSMTLVAALELSLWFRILMSAILFQKGSWILLVIYTVFFRVRYSQSSFMQSAIMQVTARADAALANQSTPPAVRNAWDSFKGIMRQASDATDINRMARQSGPAKKAQ